MKKIMLIACCVLISLSPFCQTKSETFDWIASKLVNYGGKVSGSAQNKTVVNATVNDAGEIIDKKVGVEIVTYDGKDYNWEYYYITEIFKLDDVSNVFLYDSGLKFYTTGPKVHKIRRWKSKNSESGEVEEETANEIFISIDWNSEGDLKQRMRTALIKLLEFNKPKETF